MKYPLFKVRMSPHAACAASAVLESGYIGQGAVVDDFESRLSRSLGHRWPVTVNSATSGLQLALRLVKRGAPVGRHVVLVSPLTCLATTAAIVAAGCTPRWMDLAYSDACLMPIDVREGLEQEDVLAVMPVHWGGWPNDLDMLAEECDRHRIKTGYRPVVIEDAAHAMCAEYGPSKLGSHGNFVVYSLQAIKHLTSGDGGVLLCPTKALADQARLLRWYGLDRKQPGWRLEQDVENVGYKFHMNDVAASIGMANLDDLDDTLRRHRANAELYRQLLPASVQPLENKDDRVGSYWMFSVLVENRGRLIQKLAQYEIDAGMVHRRNDEYSFAGKYGHVGALCGIKRLAKNMLCLPCGWWMTPEDVRYVCNVIGEDW